MKKALTLAMVLCFAGIAMAGNNTQDCAGYDWRNRDHVEHVTHVEHARLSQFNVTVEKNKLMVADAKVGSNYTVFDTDGKVIDSGVVKDSSFNVKVPEAGKYTVRVGSRRQLVSVI
ncbi:MAG: hypothetical protein MJY82_03835 [Fibrobacter sp.]|nr:hypothetical protein [Fibrobacter sp.]